MRRGGPIGLLGAALVVVVGLPPGCHSPPAPESGASRTLPLPLEGRTQLVTVLTKDWDSFRATLRRYEQTGGAWQEVGSPAEAVIGRRGYGWGRGLHGDGAPLGRAGPSKVEGDGKSPAGVFGIGAAYGYEEARPDLSLRYAQASDTLRCVDDSTSAYYNEIVSTDDVEVDWASAEHMRREDELYTLAIVVEHNADAPRPLGGSCIFFHLWKGPDVGMSGCTAMSMEALDELARWLKPIEAAVVALPEGEYAALRDTWDLPNEKSR